MTKKSKAQRSLRFMLRRKQCLICNLCLFTWLFLSLACGGVIGYFYWQYYQERVKLDSEDHQLDKAKNEVTFAHCNYDDKNQGFNLTFCEDRSREYAFAWRHLKTDSTDDASCFDIHQQVDCHTWLMRQKSSFKLLNKFSGCPVLDQADYKENQTLSATRHYQLSTFNMNEILHSSELFVECPVCVKTGSENTYDEKCYEKIETKKRGWPSIAAQCADKKTSNYVCS